MRITNQTFKVKSLSVTRPTETSSGYRFTLEAEIKDVEPSNGVACSTYIPDSGTILIVGGDHKIKINDCVVVARADDVNGRLTLLCRPNMALATEKVIAFDDLIGNEVEVTFTPSQTQIFNGDSDTGQFVEKVGNALADMGFEKTGETEHGTPILTMNTDKKRKKKA